MVNSLKIQASIGRKYVLLQSMQSGQRRLETIVPIIPGHHSLLNWAHCDKSSLIVAFAPDQRIICRAEPDTSQLETVSSKIRQSTEIRPVSLHSPPSLPMTHGSGWPA